MAGGEIEKIVLALVAVIVIIIVAGMLSMTFMMGGGIWGGMMGWGGMGFGWMMLLPAIFLVILIVGIYFIITWAIGEAKTPHTPDSALEIVKGRYAKGEITAEEFRKMKKDLSG